MKVLFVCRGNVGRSQMASAFFNKISEKNQSLSAGTHVGENEGKYLHEFVIRCMAESDFDLSKNIRRQLAPEMVKEVDKVVVITEKEDLPNYVKNSKKLIFWDVEDGKGKSYEFHCKIRDQIRNLVEKLVKEIG